MRRLRIAHVHFRTRHNVGDAAVVQAIRQLFGQALHRPRWSSIRLQELMPPTPAAAIRLINRHDLLIIGGGGLYSRWGLPLDESALAAITAPLVVFGAGLNRNLDDAPLDQARLASICRLHERAALASVRDSASQQLLASLGFPASLTGDPALLLQPRRHWLFRAGSGPQIGFNLAAHGWAGQQLHLEPVLAASLASLRALATRTGAQLHYLQHSDAEKFLLPRLRSELPGLRVWRTSPARLRWIYSRLDLVISMMLHSSILAYAAGTPIINLAYDDKNTAFMSDIGQAEHQLPVADLDSAVLLALAERLLAVGRSNNSEERLISWQQHTAAFVAAVAALVGH